MIPMSYFVFCFMLITEEMTWRHTRGCQKGNERCIWRSPSFIIIFCSQPGCFFPGGGLRKINKTLIIEQILVVRENFEKTIHEKQIEINIEYAIVMF